MMKFMMKEIYIRWGKKTPLSKSSLYKKSHDAASKNLHECTVNPSSLLPFR